MLFLVFLYCQILFCTGDDLNSTTLDSKSQSSSSAPNNIETTNLHNETQRNESDVIIATKFVTNPTEQDILMPKELPNTHNATEDTNNSTDANFSVFVTLNPGRQLSLEHINISCTACNISNILMENLSFKWYLNGQFMHPRREPNNLIYEGHSNTDCNNSFISFISLSNADSGTIVCLVTDEKSNISHSSNYTLNLPAAPLVSLEEFPLPLKIHQLVNISCLSYIPTRMPEGYLSAATITLAGHIIMEADDTLENSIPFHVTEKLRLNAGQEFKRVNKEIFIPPKAHSFEVTCLAANDFGRFSTGKFVVPIHNEDNMNPVLID